MSTAAQCVEATIRETSFTQARGFEVWQVTEGMSTRLPWPLILSEARAKKVREDYVRRFPDSEFVMVQVDQVRTVTA